MKSVKDITAPKAWDLLNSNPKAILIDTRTEAEWKSVGTPLLEGKIFRISSHNAPFMMANPKFLEELNKEIADKTVPVIFMCKTSGRSRIAADIALNDGYNDCYVVSDGFMGTNSETGWLNSKLPYEIL